MGMFDASMEWLGQEHLSGKHLFIGSECMRTVAGLPFEGRNLSLDKVNRGGTTKLGMHEESWQCVLHSSPSALGMRQSSP
jgi:hypothetical protein